MSLMKKINDISYGQKEYGAAGDEQFQSMDQFKSTKNQTITHDPSIQVMDTS